MAGGCILRVGNSIHVDRNDDWLNRQMVELDVGGEVQDLTPDEAWALVKLIESVLDCMHPENDPRDLLGADR